MDNLQLSNNPHFLSNSDFWISEIRGNIARLNDAAATVETDIVLPRPTDNRLDKADKIKKIRDFQFEFRRLVKNAGQVLPEKTMKKIKIWLEASQNDITNVGLLKEGVQLADELQDLLYNMRIKDINVSGPIFFPFEHYYKMIVGDDVGTAKQAAKQ